MKREKTPNRSQQRSKKRRESEKERIARSLQKFPVDPDAERVRAAIRNLPESLRGNPHLHMAAAAFVIAECLRIEVRELEVEPFFEFETSAGRASYFYTTKVGLIGETLWALRHEPGFQEFCHRLRERDMRSAAYEVIAARLMFGAGFEIRAKPETLKKGKDFDFSAARGDLIINVEATALWPETYNQNTVRHALECKRKQLPTNMPAVVFCALPESWFVGPDDIRPALHADANALFARSQRINAVAFITEKHVDLGKDAEDNQLGMLAFPFFPYQNPNPRHSTDVSFLFDETLDLNRRYDMKSDLPAAIDALQSDNAFHRWVDDIMDTA